MRNLIKPITLTMVLLIVFSGTVLAGDIPDNQDPQRIENIKITIGYDSFLYKTKLFFENIRLTNAFTLLGKANVSGAFAKRRIAEANLMVTKGDFAAAEELISKGSDAASAATEYVAEAIMKKDNGRARKVLSNVSGINEEILKYIEDIEIQYPSSFDLKEVKDGIKENILDTTVLWVFISVKESFMENESIRDQADSMLAGQESQNNTDLYDAISSATLSELDDLGIQLNDAEIDAITSATYDITTQPGANGGSVIDAVTAATQDITLLEPGSSPPPIDATSSATTVTEPAPTTTTSSSSGGVDAISSATTTAQPSGGSGTASGTSSSYEDEHEDDEHDDDEHEDDDD